MRRYSDRPDAYVSVTEISVRAIGWLLHKQNATGGFVARWNGHRWRLRSEHLGLG